MISIRKVLGFGGPTPLTVKYTLKAYRRMAKQLNYRGARFSVERYFPPSPDGHFTLRMEFPTSNSDCLEGGSFEKSTIATYSPFPPTIAQHEFVALAWRLVENLAKHEAAEWFVYNNNRPFYPHPVVQL